MKIYQAYTNAQQKDFVCANAIPFDASGNCASGTREYELFRQIHADAASHANDEPWGLVSWKFDYKSPISLGDFHRFASNAFADGADCAFINPMIGNEAVYANVWEQGIHCAHTGIEKVACFLQQETGINVATVSDTSTFAFCNYFIARPPFWDRYFSFIEHALGLLDAEAARGSEIGQIYSGSGQYQRDTSASMRIFVIERLFSSFLQQNPGLQVAAYAPTAADFDNKFGVRMGRMLWNFSRLKQRAVETDDISLYNTWDKQRCTLLADYQINIVWNLDDPFAYPLSREYREFCAVCERLFDADHPATSERIQGIAG
ncbi:MAG: hypothetical protein OEY45_01075 [Gammaproteobacteria bacterium]|nr:hypothetical protein [Gammaproteobacteria bacterium]